MNNQTLQGSRLGLTAMGAIIAISITAGVSRAQTTSFKLNPGNHSSAITFGYGESSTRVLCRVRDLNVPGRFELGWFDSTSLNPSYGLLGASGTTGGIHHAEWERGVAVPTNAFLGRNPHLNAPGVTVPGLYSVTVGPFSVGFTRIFGGDFEGGTGPFGDWTLDAIRPSTTTPNSEFFLRRASGGVSQVFRLDLNTPALPSLVDPGGPPATGPIAVNPSGNKIAHASGLTVTHYDIAGALPVRRTATFQGSSAISDVVWVDDRFLLCVVSTGPVMFPTSKRIMRVDTLSLAAPPIALTLDPVKVSNLSVSGDGEWATFVASQNLPGVVENCVAIMRVRDVTTTSPGGAYTLLAPLENWTGLNSLQIQQSGDPRSPHVLFQGTDPDPLVGMAFHRPRTVRSLSAPGRIETSASGATTTTFQATFDQGDTAMLLLVSLGRLSTPGPFGELISSPIGTVAFVVRGGSSSVTLNAGITQVPSSLRLFYQAAWFNPSAPNGIAAGNLTELPVF